MPCNCDAYTRTKILLKSPKRNRLGAFSRWIRRFRMQNSKGRFFLSNGNKFKQTLQRLAKIQMRPPRLSSKSNATLQSARNALKVLNAKGPNSSRKKEDFAKGSLLPNKRSLILRNNAS